MTLAAPATGAGRSGRLGRRLAAPDRPAATVPARPPGQPPAGPGGAEAFHGSVVAERYSDGSGEFWLFEPAAPVPARAPVVVLFHGWGAVEPWPYGAWIHHLVRRGHVVIYPRYQASLLTPPARMTDQAAREVRVALQRLLQEGRVAPDLSRTALLGHSLGGVIAANLAATAGRYGLPEPRALMVVQPGDPPRTFLTVGRSQPSILVDYRAISPELLMLVLVSDRDTTVGTVTARELFYRTSRVPPDRKDFITVRSDGHGRPALVADHYLPTALLPEAGAALALEGDAARALGFTWRQRAAVRALAALSGQPDLEQRLGPPDALDYYAVWKLSDALLEAAFYGRSREVALGGSPAQRYMGRWSDGTPVRELEVTDHP